MSLQPHSAGEAPSTGEGLERQPRCLQGCGSACHIRDTERLAAASTQDFRAREEPPSAERETEA